MMFDTAQDRENLKNRSSDTSALEYAPEAAKVIRTIASSLKNYLLYPEEHSLSQTSLSNVTSALQSFNQSFGSLVFNINKDGIYYESEKILDSSDDDDGFVTPLFRDGVLSLEFSAGIDVLEIGTFFKILKKHRVLPDEPDSDIVTDLWQAGLSHIKYQAAEVFWDTEPMFVFPRPSEDSEQPGDGSGAAGDLSYSGSESEGGEKADSVSGYDSTYFEPVSIANLGFVGGDLSLTPEEAAQLKQMVAVEERYDTSDDILELYLFILDEINSPEDLRNVLNNLAEEFGRVLIEGKIYHALRIIEKVKKFEQTSVCEIIPVKIEVNDFYKRLSGTLFSDAVFKMIPRLDRGDDDFLFFFRKVCMALDSSAVLPLVSVIPDLDSLSAKSCLFDIVTHKIRKDEALAEQLVTSDDARIVHATVLVLKKIKGENSDVLLYKLLRHHDETVRSAALDHFVEKPVSILPRLFFLINDPGLSVRLKLMKYIGAERAVPSETLMLNYVQSKEFLSLDKSHILNCYRTLGKCGSQRTILYIKEKLSGKAWKNFMGAGKNVHRDGATAALTEIELPEAKALLKKVTKR